MSSPLDAAPAVTRSLIIASAPRTGSQLLASGLLATRMVGDPEEALQPNRYDAYRRRNPGSRQYPEFRDARITIATGDHGVRCSTVKLNGMRWAIAMERSYGDGLVDLDDAAVMERLFPAPAWVFLRREDTARQAISWYRALIDERWRRWAGEADTRPSPAEPVWERLAWLEENAQNHERRWREFFATHQITPIEITYEQVAADVPGVVATLLSAVGLQVAESFADFTPSIEPMADDVSAEWLERYLANRGSIEASPLAVNRHRPD